MIKTLSLSTIIFVILSFLFTSCSNQEKGTSDMLMSVEEFAELLEKEDLLVLDIRDLPTYQRGHIPGAMLLSAFDIEAQAPAFAAMDKRTVTYCSCPAEESSIAAALALRKAGAKQVHVLVGGYIEWKNQGRALVIGDRPY